MSYAILRVAKLSGGSVAGMQQHNQREYKNHSNQDIDKSKSYLNYDLVNKNPINFNKAWKENKEKYFKEGNRFRKDTIVLVEGIVTSDKSFFENMNDKEIKDYFETNLDFLKSEYGEHNIISANVHLDENTPHMHFTFTPITKDGRFSAKEVIGNRGDLRKLQDRYHKHLTDKGYELLRGVKVEQTKAKNETVKEYKKNQINKDLDQINKMKKEIDDLTREYNEIVKSLDVNSLNIAQIDSISVQETKGLFKSDNYIKLKKSDYEKIKNSAIKAYEQHSLYATVEDQLKRLEKSNDFYKSESQTYRIKLDNEIYKSNVKIHSLKNELNKYKKELNEHEEFLEKNDIEIDFKHFKKELKKSKQNQSQKEKYNNLELEL